MANGKVHYPSLDTPAVLMDLDKLEANIAEMSRFAKEAGVKLRPHTKIHESPDIAKMQIGGGACGIEVGTVDRAQCMAEAGIKDILIAHPFYGERKMESFKGLLIKTGLKLTVLVDMMEQVKSISAVAQSVGKKIPVLLKINTGGGRFGVLPGEPALEMAKKLTQVPAIQLTGIYAHESGGKPTPEAIEELAFQTAKMTTETARLLRKEGIPIEHVSVGASPTFRATCRLLKDKKFSEITEIHPGHCAVGDIWHVRALGNTREACAATVLTTVMSTTHPDYVVIDAGYKTWGNDLLFSFREAPDFFWKGKPSFGSVQGRPDLWLGKLSAETACVYYMDTKMDPKKRIGLGERLEIVPNNATLVIALQDKIYGVRNNRIEKELPVGGRKAKE